MGNYAIILAGGEGKRAGGVKPKQFQEIFGKPVVWWSMKSFIESDKDMKLIAVVHPDYVDDWNVMWRELAVQDFIPHSVCKGGKTRPESVANGLACVKEHGGESDAVVLIHDGARPLVSVSMIRRGLDRLEKGTGLIPAVKSVNSLREIEHENGVSHEVISKSVDRSKYVEVQTPQIFRFEDIAPLYKNAERLSSFTDDASVAEANGIIIKLYEGETYNIKITHPVDFRIAEAIMSWRENDKV